jgi:hypothetical protein
MTSEAGFIRGTKQYKGCGIRAASYKAGPQSWVPEASFWLNTENGVRRLWVNSFAQCLALQHRTFPNKLEADLCAYRLAQMLIDKTLPEFERPSSVGVPSPPNYFAKMLNIARRPFSSNSTPKELKSHD